MKIMIIQRDKEFNISNVVIFFFLFEIEKSCGIAEWPRLIKVSVATGQDITETAYQSKFSKA